MINEKEREKKRKERKRKRNLATLTGSLHYCTLLSKEFLLFSPMPVPIETVAPVRTAIAIHLMVSFAIHAFEDVRAWLTVFGSRLVCFFVVHATPCFLSVVFGRVSSIAFGASGDMRTTAECRVAPLPTVLALRDIWICVGTSNGSDVASNIEASVDDVLSYRTALGIPDVHPNHHLVGFGGRFDDTRF